MSLTEKKVQLGQLVVACSVAEKTLHEHYETKPSIKAGRRNHNANMLATAEHRLTQQRLFDSWRKLQAEELALAREIIAEEKP